MIPQLISMSHVIIVLVVVVLLFGASKLPELAKSIGKSAKILKKEMRELTEEDTPAGEIQATKAEEDKDKPTQ